MTLVLTEISNAGIAMAADSAITMFVNGKIKEVDEEGWLKILRVPKIKAAVSYWGMIGAVTSLRFDHWLQQVIDAGNYADLPSFADHLALELNKACRNKPLAEGQEVGVHVAGYCAWVDNVQRPVFYHVHNGHGGTNIEHEVDEQGRVVAVYPKWTPEPRKLFEKHQDFPMESKSIEENLEILQYGYTTRNGAYFIYAVLWNGIQRSIQYVNLVPDISIPRDPLDVASRKGFLHIVLEMMIKFYRCSNQSRIVGGTVTSLGIRQGEYVL